MGQSWLLGKVNWLRPGAAPDSTLSAVEQRGMRLGATWGRFVSFRRNTTLWLAALAPLARCRNSIVVRSLPSQKGKFEEDALVSLVSGDWRTADETINVYHRRWGRRERSCMSHRVSKRDNSNSLAKLIIACGFISGAVSVVVAGVPEIGLRSVKMQGFSLSAASWDLDLEIIL